MWRGFNERAAFGFWSDDAGGEFDFVVVAVVVVVVLVVVAAAAVFRHHFPPMDAGTTAGSM